MDPDGQQLTDPNRASATAPSPASRGLPVPSGPDLGGPSPFADDDGSVPGEVAEVLQRLRAGRAGLRDVVPVLAAHRLLVPLLEVDADLLEGDDADPCTGQDRAVAAVSMRTEQGSVGLAFTGMAALVAWDPLARPLPVPATRLAAAILAEEGIGLVVDPGAPGALRLAGAALVRLAQGGPWPLPWQDPAVQQAVTGELAPALSAGDLGVRLGQPPDSDGGGAGPSLLVELRFPPGLGDAERESRSAVVARRLRGSAALRAVFDGVLAVRAV